MWLLWLLVLLLLLLLCVCMYVCMCVCMYVFCWARHKAIAASNRNLRVLGPARNHNVCIGLRAQQSSISTTMQSHPPSDSQTSFKLLPLLLFLLLQLLQLRTARRCSSFGLDSLWLTPIAARKHNVVHSQVYGRNGCKYRVVVVVVGACMHLLCTWLPMVAHAWLPGMDR